MVLEQSHIKSCLEKWREPVLLVDSVLGWDKDFYPAITFGVLTLNFLIVWYMDMTLLTLLALAGLGLTLADFLGPKIMDKVFKPESWTGEKEKKLDTISADLANMGQTVSGAAQCVSDAKSKKPVIHFLGTVCALFTLAWIGNRVNNFFLLYFFVLTLAMLPGLHRRGLLQKYFSQVTLKISETMKGNKEAWKKVE